MAKHSFWDFLNGYEVPLREDGSKSITGKRFFCRAVTGSVRKNKGRTLISAGINLGNKLTRLLSYTLAKSYGVSIMVFGIVSFIGFLLADYLPLTASPRDYMAIGIVSALFAIPLLLSDKPFAIAVQDNRLIGFILFDFFSVKRAHRTDSDYPSIPIPVSIILGFLLGVGGYFISVWSVVIGAFALLLVYVTFLSPEFAFFLSLLVLPYLSYIPLSEVIFPILIFLTLLSFLRKVAFGKRFMFLEQYEFLLGLMLLVILVSGIFLKGTKSFTDSLTMIAMGMGYILSGNIITNRRLADSTLNAFVVSSIPAAVYSYYLVGRAIISGSGEALIGVGIGSTFKSTDAYAVFLLAVIVFAVALAKQSYGFGRAAYSIIAIVNLGALVLTGELFALLVLLLGAVVLCILRTRSAILPLMMLACLVPYAVVLIPDGIIDPVLAIIPGINEIGELKSLWHSCVTAIADHPWLGIGIGTESFLLEMQDYGVMTFSDSKNIFIELGLEAGAFAPLLFIAALFVRLRHRAAYHSYVKHSQLRVASNFSSVAVFCLIAFGATEYIWQDFNSIYLFFVIFGMGAATLRAAKKEVDDKVLYYEDTRAQDSSAIDVEIR